MQRQKQKTTKKNKFETKKHWAKQTQEKNRGDLRCFEGYADPVPY